MEFRRPETKQVFRKCLGRPITSKGVRPLEKNVKSWQPETKANFFSQYISDEK
jgi:hypothetical protein